MIYHNMTHTLIQKIAAELDVSVEDVNAVLEGRRVVDDERLRGIIHGLSANGTGIYLLAVWKDTVSAPVPSLEMLRNSPNYHFYGQILEALNLYLDKHGYTSQLLINNLQLVNDAYFEAIIARHPGAGIVNLAANFTGGLQRVCEAHQRPIVYLDYPLDGVMTDQYVITVYSRPAIAAVVEHLYQLGHRRIALIKGLQNKIGAVDRVEGYKTGLMQVGLDYDAALVIDGDWQPETGEAAAEKLLALENRPTAIIASNDLMAFGVMKAVQKRGLTIPHDVSLVGYDDIAAAQMATPPLSSVRLPMSEIGAKVGQYIVDLLEGTSPEPRQVTFSLEVVMRESVGPAPAQQILPN